MTLRDNFFADDFFARSWHDFDRLRSEMFKESEEFWRSAERQMSSMLQESSSSSTTSKAVSTTSPSALFPRRWMLPRLFNEEAEDTLKSLDIFQHKDDQVIRIRDDDRAFELSLDTHGYRPDELKVNVAGDTLTVEAKHEEKGDNRFVSRQFKRSYTLPEGCEAHKVNSNLSSDGLLLITAPKKAAINHDDGNRAIPIEMKK